VSKNTLVKELVATALGPPAEAEGFEYIGSRTWLRHTAEISQMIRLDREDPPFLLFWGLWEPTAAEVVHGIAAAEPNFGTCVVWGDAWQIHLSSTREELDADEITEENLPLFRERLPKDVGAMANHMAALPTRRSVRDYLLVNRLDSDWEREFTQPTSLGLKLVTVAALALADEAPDAGDLVVEAREWLVQHRFPDDPKLERLERLAEQGVVAASAEAVLYWKYEEDAPDGAEDEATGPAWITNANGSDESLNEGEWISRARAVRIAAERGIRLDDKA
jgi:hypothetical protein